MVFASCVRFHLICPLLPCLPPDFYSSYCRSLIHPSATVLKLHREIHHSRILRGKKTPSSCCPWQFWQLERRTCLIPFPSSWCPENIFSFYRRPIHPTFHLEGQISLSLSFFSFFSFLFNPIRHRWVQDFSWSLWKWNLCQHARQLWVWVLRRLREWVHDDEELHG